MLGSESLVVRVDPDQTVHQLEILPELFLGSSLRRLLEPEVRSGFDRACADAVAQLETVVFTIPAAETASCEIVITPVVDRGPVDEPAVCRFLLCWARTEQIDSSPCTDAASGWHELDPAQIQVRFRMVGPDLIEAAPWWNRPGCGPVDLWLDHERVAAVGLGLEAMTATISGAIVALGELVGDRSDTRLRVQAPAAEMLAGIVPVLAGLLRATAAPAGRLTIVVPVELAVDPNVLPLVLHLQNLGVGVELAGLDHLTASLRRVTGLPGAAPAPVTQIPAVVGPWVGVLTDLDVPAVSA